MIYTDNKIFSALLAATLGLMVMANVGCCDLDSKRQIDINAQLDVPELGRAERAVKHMTPVVIDHPLTRRTKNSAQAAPNHNLSAAPKALASAPTDSLRARLLPKLMGYEYVPTRSDLIRLASPEALVDALMDIHTDTSLHLKQRIQALVCLRFFPTPAVRLMFEDVLSSDATSNIVRRPAVRAFGAGFGVEALAKLNTLLVHPDVHTRDSVVRAMVRIGGAEVAQLLKARVGVEQAPTVTHTLQQLIPKIPSAPVARPAAVR